MAGLYNIGTTYLGKQVQINNGGVLGFVLNNLKFDNGTMSTSNIENITVWTTYISQFVFNSTRLEPVHRNDTYQLNNQTTSYNPNRTFTIMMILWLLMYIILLAAVVAVYVNQHLTDKNAKMEIADITFTMTRTRTIFLKRIETKRFFIILSMIITATMWTIFFILLCTTQYLVNSQFRNNTSSTNTTTNSTKSYASIGDSVTWGFTYLGNFVHILTNQTGEFISSSLSILAANTRNQLNSSIVGFGNQVLVTFNITDLFNTAQALLTSINLVINSMTFINDNCQNILADVDKTKGSINVYQDYITNYLTKICPNLSYNVTLQSICQILLIRNSEFKVAMQTSAVSSSSSIIMLFVLKQYNINISEITNTFVQIDTNFKTNLNVLFTNTVNSFDITSYLTIVNQIWSSLVTMMSPYLSGTTSYSTTVSSAVSTASNYENIAGIVLIVVIFISSVLVLSLSFLDSVEERFLNRCVNCLFHLVFVFVSILSVLFCIVLLVMTNFSQSEVCNQVNTTSGVAVLDQMIDHKMTGPWYSLTQLAKSSSPGFNFTLMQPTNILSGVKDRCRNTSVGLLSVVGMKNFVNVTEIVRSPSIMAIVSKARNDSLKAFLDVNPSQIIPQDLASFFSQTAKVIGYFDSIDYTKGIVQLQIPLVGIVDFVGYFKNLSTLAINAASTVGWTSDLTYLNETVNQLQTTVPNLTNTQQNVHTLRAHFEILQTYRNNSYLMNKLTSTMTNVQNLFLNTTLLTSIFSTIYNDMISIKLLNAVDQLISDGINKITSQMIPCNDLSMMFEAVTTTMCSNSNFIVSLATLAIILLVESVFCLIMSIIILTALSLRVNLEHNTSRC